MQITNISGVCSLTSLRVLELGGNRIRKIENLDGLVNLEELWLGKNKITTIENLEGLFNLRRLSLQSNRIVEIKNLSALTNLEGLYLSENGIECIENLGNLVRRSTMSSCMPFIYVFMSAILASTASNRNLLPKQRRKILKCWILIKIELAKLPISKD